MGETIENIFIESLKEGKVFDRDELIISVDEISMTTIRKEPDFNEIRYFIYDINRIDEKLCSVHNNGRGEVDYGDKFYNRYKRKLKRVGLWRENHIK